MASRWLSTTVKLHARGAADPDLVWERYAQPALWTSWSPQITGVDTDAERIAVGARGTVHGPLGLAVAFEVTAVDDVAREWSWRVVIGPATVDLYHNVIAEPAGTLTNLRVTGPTLVVLGYVPPAKLAMARLVRP
jgi:hypothetical protein